MGLDYDYFDGLWEQIFNDATLILDWDMTSTPIETPQSAIEEPEPHADDERIQ